MTGNRSIPGTLLVIVLLAAAVLTGLFLWDTYGEKARPARDALPSEFSLLIRFPDLENLLVRMNSDGTLANRIIGWKGLEKASRLTASLDSLLAGNLRISELARESTHYLVSCRRPDTTPGWLWISEFRDPPDRREFRRLMGSAFPAGTMPSPGNRDRSVISISYGDAILSYSFRNGLFLASNDEGLVVEAIERLRSNDPSPGEFPESLFNSAGRNVDANLMVNYAALREDYAFLVDPGLQDKFSPERFASFSVFDIVIRPYELMVNGYSKTIPGRDEWLAPLVGAIPGEMEFQMVLPVNTLQFTGYGGEIAMPLPDIPAGRWLTSWKDQGSARAKVKVPGQGNPRPVGIFRILPGTDPLAAQAYGVDIQPHSVIEGVQAYTIHTDLGQLIPWVFGNQEAYYFAILGNFMVISPDEETLGFIIENFVSDRRLSDNNRYQRATAKLTETGNFIFYLDLKQSLQELVSWLDPAGQRFIRDNLADVQRFISLVVQGSGTGDLIYTNVSVPFDTNSRASLQTAWEVRLDASLADGPFVLEDGTVPGHFILARDADSGTYLIDQEGDIVWKAEGIAPLVGEPSLMEIQCKPFILLTLPGKLHCLSWDGSPAPGFPVKLESPAAAPAVVVGTSTKNGMKILVTCRDKAAYAFTETGKPVKNWQPPLTSSLPYGKPVYIFSGKDAYILICDENGRVMALDPRGKLLFRTKESFRKSLRTGYWLNKTNSKGVLLTTDSRGMLSYISAKGNVQQTDFGKFSAAHDFFYFDINGKGGEDFIFADGSSLKAFDRFRHLLWEFNASGAEDLHATLLFAENRKVYISLATSSGRAWLIDQDGRLLTEEEFMPGVPLHFIEISEEGAGVISGHDEFVVKYVLPLSDQ